MTPGVQSYFLRVRLGDTPAVIAGTPNVIAGIWCGVDSYSYLNNLKIIESFKMSFLRRTESRLPTHQLFFFFFLKKVKMIYQGERYIPMILIGGLDILKAREAVVCRKNQGLLGPWR